MEEGKNLLVLSLYRDGSRGYRLYILTRASAPNYISQTGHLLTIIKYDIAAFHSIPYTIKIRRITE